MAEISHKVRILQESIQISYLVSIFLSFHTYSEFLHIQFIKITYYLKMTNIRLAYNFILICIVKFNLLHFLYDFNIFEMFMIMNDLKSALPHQKSPTHTKTFRTNNPSPPMIKYGDYFLRLVCKKSHFHPFQNIFCQVLIHHFEHIILNPQA